MAVCLERERSNTVTFPGAESITVGLVNNMPDTALQATERQFMALLGSAADHVVVRLRVYALPDVPRAAWGRDYVDHYYAPIDDLWNSHLDGLIVTGTEPRSQDLRDEPYWGTLTKLLEWAEENTRSAVWSCLAAHAAVLHLDGIERRPLDDKRFGVFECDRFAAHPLTADLPARIRMPHSRWNETPEDALTSAGYHVLTRSARAGVDAFAKERKSLFVFLQGHPEYEAHTLMLEYRRDIKRFLQHERETYPTIPQGYFDAATVRVLTALRERAHRCRQEEVLAEFPAAFAAWTVMNAWRPAAVHLYRSWLRHLCARKASVA
jgi:homoserine O-succinyltransferase/O-acetyltransferase